MTWEYRRTEQFDVVRRAWSSGHGVLLSGPAGIGKTALARHFATSIGRRPLWIIATPGMVQTPLAAVASVVETERLGDTAAIVETLRARVRSGEIVVVEGAEYLDPSSEAVIARLFTSVACAGLLTARDAAGPVLGRALGAAGVVEVAMTPLELNTVAEMVEHRVDGRLSVDDAVRLHRTTAGNPFLLIACVDSAFDGGSLTVEDGVIALDGAFGGSPDLLDLGADRLERANDAERELIDLLSLCEPLPRAVVDHLGLADGISDAEGGLVLPLDDAVVPGHLIYTAIRRATMGLLERRVRASRLADAMNAVDGGPIGRVHRARLCLDYTMPISAGDLAESAALAFMMGDFPMAERCARAAVTAGGGLGALLQLARAQSGMGRSALAHQTLDGVDPDSLDADELGGYAISAALTFLVGDGDHSGAVTVLDKFEPRLESAAALSSFAAVRALAHVNAGAQAAALRWSRRAQALAAGAPLWTSLGEYVEAESLRRSGEVRRPVHLASDALVQAGQLGSVLATGARRTIVQALLADGDVGTAAAVADKLLEATLLHHVPRAIACATRAAVDIARGQHEPALRLCAESLQSLGEYDRTGLGRGVAMLVALVCAETGDVDGARRAVEQSTRGTVAADGWGGINPRLAAAFTAVAEGELIAPSAVLRDIAQTCIRAEQWTDAVAVLHCAVRWGDVEAARMLTEAAATCEGRTVEVQRRHASALAASDAEGLVLVSGQFADLGFIPSAVDALGQAVVAHRSAGRAGLADTLLTCLSALQGRCGPLDTPALRAALGPAGLTRRESEVTWLLASGESVQQIADRLSVRAPTVRALAARARAKSTVTGH